MKKNYIENLREELNRVTLEYTYKYQKIYDFEIGTGKEATHNNDADAFKHAFMQAYLMMANPKNFAKIIGDYHEYIEGWNYDKRENNMDLWNNAIGREVVHNIKSILGRDYEKYSTKELLDMAANQICQKMQKGELITNPFKDKRQYKNMEKERLKDSDRVFYDGEYWDDMDEDERRRYSDHYTNYKNQHQKGMPSKAELQARALVGDLIYVNNYTRADGTKVNGYYRRRVTY